MRSFQLNVETCTCISISHVRAILKAEFGGDDGLFLT